MAGDTRKRPPERQTPRGRCPRRIPSSIGCLGCLEREGKENTDERLVSMDMYSSSDRLFGDCQPGQRGEPARQTVEDAVAAVGSLLATRIPSHHINLSVTPASLLFGLWYDLRLVAPNKSPRTAAGKRGRSGLEWHDAAADWRFFFPARIDLMDLHDIGFHAVLALACPS